MKNLLLILILSLLSFIGYGQNKSSPKEQEIKSTILYQQTRDVVQGISSELKAPAEKIYKAFYKQQYINVAAINIILIILLFFAIILAVIGIIKRSKIKNKIHRDDYLFLYVVSLLLFFIALTVFIASFSYRMTVLYNPDYNAIQDIVHIITK